jgi:sporulation protein YlmC with PRC-barrel domain
MTSKNSLSTALLIAALALPVSAFAQTTTAPSPSAPPAAAAPRTAAPAATAPAAASHTLPAAVQASRHMRDDQIRASKLIGAAVYDPADQKIGTVDELVLNPDGKVADVVIGVGGFLGAGEKRVAVPMAELKRGKNDHFVLAATKDSLKQMAAFELKTASTGGRARGAQVSTRTFAGAWRPRRAPVRFSVSYYPGQEPARQQSDPRCRPAGGRARHGDDFSVGRPAPAGYRPPLKHTLRRRARQRRAAMRCSPSGAWPVRRGALPGRAP